MYKEQELVTCTCCIGGCPATGAWMDVTLDKISSWRPDNSSSLLFNSRSVAYMLFWPSKICFSSLSPWLSNCKGITSTMTTITREWQPLHHTHTTHVYHYYTKQQDSKVHHRSLMPHPLHHHHHQPQEYTIGAVIFGLDMSGLIIIHQRISKGTIRGRPAKDTHALNSLSLSEGWVGRSIGRDCCVWLFNQPCTQYTGHLFNLEV